MIVDLVIGAWAGILENAADIAGVLDGGRAAVYEWMAKIALDAGGALIPAVQVALSACETIAPGVCEAALIGVMVRVIADVCGVIGLDKVIDAFLWLWDQVPDWVKDGIGYAADAVSFLIDSGVDGAVALGKKAWAWVSSPEMYTEAFNWLEEQLYAKTIGRLGNYLSTAVDDAGEYVIELVASAQEYIKGGAKYLLHLLDEAKGSIPGVIILTTVKEVREAAEYVVAKVGEVVEAIEAVAEAAIDTVGEAVEDIGAAIDDAGDAIWDVIKVW